jgi:hypothetical protein
MWKGENQDSKKGPNLKRTIILTCLLLSACLWACSETDHKSASESTCKGYDNASSQPALIASGTSDIPQGFSSPPSQPVPGDFHKPLKPNEPEKPWPGAALWKDFSETKSHASFKVRINDSLPEYTIEIAGHSRDDLFYPSNLTINDSSTGRLVQKLNIKRLFNNDLFPWIKGRLRYYNQIIQFVDLNNDGYLDLRVLYNDGATGNNWYVTLLYDRKSKQFKLNIPISQLSGVVLDTDSKQIVTYNRCGWCAELREYFRVKGDKLELTKLEWTDLDVRREDKCLKVTGIPTDKNLRINNMLQFVCDYNVMSPRMKKRIKIVKTESLKGSLQPRGWGGEIDLCGQAQ